MAPLASGHSEPPREALRARLDAGRRTVVYPLTGRGFASEVLHTLLAALHCLQRRRRLLLDARGWNCASCDGWGDYFQPFCGGVGPAEPREDVTRLMRGARGWGRAADGFRRVASTRLAGRHVWKPMRSQRFLHQRFVQPDLGIDGPIGPAMARVAELVWAPNHRTAAAIDDARAAVPSAPEAVGVHLRRGDKVAGPSKEVDATAIERYVHAAGALGADRRGVLVVSDDSHAVEEFRAACPRTWPVLHRPTGRAGGHSQEEFNAAVPEVRRARTLDVIADVQLLSECSAFVGTYTSNIARLVHLLRRGAGCLSLDTGWTPV